MAVPCFRETHKKTSREQSTVSSMKSVKALETRMLHANKTILCFESNAANLKISHLKSRPESRSMELSQASVNQVSLQTPHVTPHRHSTSAPSQTESLRPQRKPGVGDIPGGINLAKGGLERSSTKKTRPSSSHGSHQAGRECRSDLAHPSSAQESRKCKQVPAPAKKSETARATRNPKKTADRKRLFALSRPTYFGMPFQHSGRLPSSEWREVAYHLSGFVEQRVRQHCQPETRGRPVWRSNHGKMPASSTHFWFGQSAGAQTEESDRSSGSHGYAAGQGGQDEGQQMFCGQSRGRGWLGEETRSTSSAEGCWHQRDGSRGSPYGAYSPYGAPRRERDQEGNRWEWTEQSNSDTRPSDGVEAGLEGAVDVPLALIALRKSEAMSRV